MTERNIPLYLSKAELTLILQTLIAASIAEAQKATGKNLPPANADAINKLIQHLQKF